MTVRPATVADIDGMIDLLHSKMNSKMAPEHWQRLFEYPWANSPPDYGRVAVIEGQVVGCVVVLYVERDIGDGLRQFGNACAWYLDKSARGQGLGLELMATATGNPDCHYMVNTSSRKTTELLERAGFRAFDDAKLVWQCAARPINGALELIRDVETTDMDPAIRKILDDHAGLAITPVKIVAEDKAGWLIVSESLKGGGTTWYDTLYVSDPSLLAEHGAEIAAQISNKDNAVFACDTRFCRGPSEGAEVQPLLPPRYIKHDLPDGLIYDHLYTELQALGLKLS